ncbi:MAG: iron-sulfur cluster assembly accessory protein [Elusimicrobia bacterium]|nr:iron-sulfur cluster assembly accessory protein [Elusimicrobiota bacterium]
MIGLTAGAAQKVQALLAKEGKPRGFLRVKVSSGGCAGMSVAFEISDQASGDDKVYESNGAKVVIDPKSEFFLFGSTVDWQSSLMKSGFVMQNPNATSTCGCGTSFSV